MQIRTAHRLLGIVLIIPFFAWALTGLVFFLKPGYTSAYEILVPKTYPIKTELSLTPESDWLEMRYTRTILGDHLLVRTNNGWMNLNPESKQRRSKPSELEVRSLAKDAFNSNLQRYGEIEAVNGNEITTSTGVQVTLDWDRLSFQQKGKDTEWIDLLYRIHYLQWTGIRNVDRILGLVGISLVLLLTTLGAWLALRRV